MASPSSSSTVFGGVSLMLSFNLALKGVIVIGNGTLAASRAFAALQADSSVIVLADGGIEQCCEDLKWRERAGQIQIEDLNKLLSTEDGLSRFLQTLETRICFAFITDTLLSTANRRSKDSALALVKIFRERNILTNVSDMPLLCDFTLPATQRILHSKTGKPTSLQLAVTTNGQGCRLATRLRRDIVSNISSFAGDAVEMVGKLRKEAKRLANDGQNLQADCNIDSDDSLPATPNTPAPQLAISKATEDVEEKARRRMRWIAQMSEFWPLEQLGSLSEPEQEAILAEESPLDTKTFSIRNPISSQHDLELAPKRRGEIYLLGSGPGHPALLTVAAHEVLTKRATLVLSDKLVPSQVLDLIPKTTIVKIAKKFPGNADGAQNELMLEAVEAAKKGEIVVRLKQGDPSIFGRAGEEILHFRQHGFESIVVPGISSALAGPTFTNISLTQRGVAESFIVCTGVGRQGKPVTLPGYIRSRTLVLLMGVARLDSLLETLTGVECSGLRDGNAYPLNTPVAIIERASMPDQRVIMSTLGNIKGPMESVGEQRPPGMIVIGWAVLALWGEGDITVLDGQKGSSKEEEGVVAKVQEESDEERIVKWLGTENWIVKEGLPEGWSDLMKRVEQSREIS